jgi:hypothetical protein
MEQVTRAELADPDGRVAEWLRALAASIPAPPGGHGELRFTITAEWDHVRLGE